MTNKLLNRKYISNTHKPLLSKTWILIFIIKFHHCVDTFLHLFLFSNFIMYKNKSLCLEIALMLEISSTYVYVIRCDVFILLTVDAEYKVWYHKCYVYSLQLMKNFIFQKIFSACHIKSLNGWLFQKRYFNLFSAFDIDIFDIEIISIFHLSKYIPFNHN